MHQCIARPRVGSSIPRSCSGLGGCRHSQGMARMGTDRAGSAGTHPGCCHAGIVSLPACGCPGHGAGTAGRWGLRQPGWEVPEEAASGWCFIFPGST